VRRRLLAPKRPLFAPLVKPNGGGEHQARQDERKPEVGDTQSGASAVGLARCGERGGAPDLATRPGDRSWRPMLRCWGAG